MFQVHFRCISNFLFCQGKFKMKQIDQKVFFPLLFCELSLVIILESSSLLTIIIQNALGIQLIHANLPGAAQPTERERSQINVGRKNWYTMNITRADTSWYKTSLFIFQCFLGQ